MSIPASIVVSVSRDKNASNASTVDCSESVVKGGWRWDA